MLLVGVRPQGHRRRSFWESEKDIRILIFIYGVKFCILPAVVFYLATHTLSEIVSSVLSLVSFSLAMQGWVDRVMLICMGATAMFVARRQSTFFVFI